MSLETFNFPFHSVGAIEYPTNTTIYELGGGYQYGQIPVDPTARTFKITMTGMKYYLQSNGAIDTTSEPTTNIYTLDQFYQTHGIHTAFNYPHWFYGTLKVKFARPLKIPQPEGNQGVLPPFDIELIEVPY